MQACNSVADETVYKETEWLRQIALVNTAVKDALSNNKNHSATDDDELQLHLRVDGLPTNADIKVLVRFYEVQESWITRMYQNYFDVLWTKLQRQDSQRPSKNCPKWFYKCLVCDRVLCYFRSMKLHLNAHLEMFPYKCTHCSKRYTSRQSLLAHKRKKHGISIKLQKK